jgi:hypothetical protein
MVELQIIYEGPGSISERLIHLFGVEKFIFKNSIIENLNLLNSLVYSNYNQASYMYINNLTLNGLCRNNHERMCNIPCGIFQNQTNFDI